MQVNTVGAVKLMMYLQQGKDVALVLHDTEDVFLSSDMIAPEDLEEDGPGDADAHVFAKFDVEHLTEEKHLGRVNLECGSDVSPLIDFEGEEFEAVAPTIELSLPIKLNKTEG
jgi:hypothetical protein